MSKISQSKVKVLEVLPIFRPAMGEEEIQAVAQVLRSGWIGLGPKTEEFEKKFAKYVGAKYAVALNSATAALHLSLLALAIKHGDEVLLPALTFVSDAHAVLYTGAKPIFVDIDPDTLCLDPKDLEKKITKKSKAVIPVHYGGHPADLDAIQKIIAKKEIHIIEDASHAAGSRYKGKMIGSISALSCFSFQAVKNLATGDGGMVTTNQQELADKIRRLRWVGINKETWEREEQVLQANYQNYGWYYDVTNLGYKYHMNDIAAAIGLVQLKKLERMNARRRLLFKRYNQKLKKFTWLKIPTIKPWAKSAHHNYVIQTLHRDSLNIFLKEQKISSGVHYVPIHHFSYYRRSKIGTKVPITEKIWKTLLTLPLYPTLSFNDQDRIISAIKKFGKIVKSKYGAVKV